MNRYLLNDTDCNGYFEELPKLTQLMVKRMLIDAFETNVSVDTYGSEGSYRIDEVECHRRDGFIPFSHNKGGLEISGYADLMGIQGSGCYPNDKKSRDKIQASADYSVKMAAEQFLESNKAELKAIGITKISDFDYHKLYKIGQANLAEKLSEYESENLSGDYSTVKYSYRIMYHGKDARGIHHASISAAINTEAPYHRAKYDDNAKEVEIIWRNGSELKMKLDKALKTVTKAVF